MNMISTATYVLQAGTNTQTFTLPKIGIPSGIRIISSFGREVTPIPLISAVFDLNSRTVTVNIGDNAVMPITVVIELIISDEQINV